MNEIFCFNDPMRTTRIRKAKGDERATFTEPKVTIEALLSRSGDLAGRHTRRMLLVVDGWPGHQGDFSQRHNVRR
jgi:hypothetical protein